jgi:hypothetical protein
MLHVLRNALTAGSVSIAILLNLATIARSDQTTLPFNSSYQPQLDLASTDDVSEDDDSLSQITSVAQLSDVKPTDWAFQALQSLVERYGCIVGYPNKNYRGNRGLTRYEFAAGLNACLGRVNELVAASTADLVKEADLATLQTLQEQFAAELATLRGRVDALEARTTTLEKQQFSPVTKLAGEVIFAIADEFNQPTNNSTTFGSRVRLRLETSFTGTDFLNTRLAAGNADIFALQDGGIEGIQTFNFGNTVTNSLQVDWIGYFFQLGSNMEVYLEVTGGGHYDYADTLAGPLESYDGGTGALSIFGQRNPIYLIGGGSGAALTYRLSPAVALTAGYLADNSDPLTSEAGSLLLAANRPDRGGLFNGSYAALAQLTLTPNDFLSIGFTYINAYRRFAIFDLGSGFPSSGTLLANGVGLGATVTPSRVNAYGAGLTYRVNPGFHVSTWLSYINADFIDLGRGDIWTYALTLAFPDLGKTGNLGGLVVGVEPYLGNAPQLIPGARNDLPIHLEGFYKYQLTDNISITPGVTWIIAPGQNSNNRDAVIGTVRTTFTF